MALRANSWTRCPQLPYHLCKNRMHSTCFCSTRWKYFWPPPPTIFAKNMPQKYAIQWGSVWHKSRLESRDFYRKCGLRTPPSMAYEPPPFYAICTVLLGVRVVFNLLTKGSHAEIRPISSHAMPKMLVSSWHVFALFQGALAKQTIFF